MKHAGSCLAVSTSFRDPGLLLQPRVLMGSVEKGKRGCSHLPPLGDEARMLDLRDQILVRQRQCPVLSIQAEYRVQRLLQKTSRI